MPFQTADTQGFLPRKACERCHVQKLRCDSREGSCTRCAKAGLTCFRGPSLRRQRAPRSKRAANRTTRLTMTSQSSAGSVDVTASPTDSLALSITSDLDYSLLDTPGSRHNSVGGLFKPVQTPVDPSWIMASTMPPYTGAEYATDMSFMGAFSPVEKAMDPNLMPHLPSQASRYPVTSQPRSKSLPDAVPTAEIPYQLSESPRPQFTAAQEQYTVKELTQLNQRLHENATRVLRLVSSRRMQAQTKPPEETLLARPHVTFEQCPLVKETVVLTEAFMKLLEQSSGTQSGNMYHQSGFQMLSPTSQDAETGGLSDRYRQSSQAPVGERIPPTAAFQTQSSILFLLSCYLCLLETFEAIISCLELEIDKCELLRSTLLAASPTAELQHKVTVAIGNTAYFLGRTQALLNSLRECIRSSSAILDGEDEHPPRPVIATNDITRPAVLAVQVRDCNLVNWTNRLRQTLQVNFGTE